jgi:hypothetical protein
MLGLTEMRYLKRQRLAKLHTIAHPPATWHHIHHDRERERSAGELVFGDEARGRHPHSSHCSQCNSGVAGHGRDRTSGGHANGRRREHRQPRVVLAVVQRSVAHVAGEATDRPRPSSSTSCPPGPLRSGTPPRMSRAWEAAGHGVPTGRSVSRVLLFLAGDRTFTSWVLNPAPVHGDGRWGTSVIAVE